MKRLRLLLVVLLSLVIPVNGFAATPASVCPMQAPDRAEQIQAPDRAGQIQAQEGAGQVNTAEMVAMSAVMPDCCPEMDDESPSTQACKPGQACSVGWLFFALPTPFSFPPPVGRIALTHYASPLFNGQTATIWHPPRQS